MSDLQKDMADLQSQIDQTEKRRGELLDDLAKTTQGIADKRQTLGSEMLAGRSAGKGLDTLAIEGVKVDALQEGIAQADDQIRRLKQEYTNKERAAAQLVFDRVKAETNDLVVAGVSKLYELQAAIEAIDTKFIELSAAGGSYIQNIQYIDDVRRLQNVVGMLKNVMTGGTSQTGAVVLKNLEQEYQELVTQAKERKNR